MPYQLQRRPPAFPLSLFPFPLSLYPLRERDSGEDRVQRLTHKYLHREVRLLEIASSYTRRARRLFNSSITAIATSLSEFFKNITNIQVSKTLHRVDLLS